MIKKFGRNDPCPCGSEKKYKHCCLDLGIDSESALDADMFEPHPWPEEPAAGYVFSDKVMIEPVPHGKGPEIELLKHHHELYAEYKRCEPEIEAAADVLEHHRREYEALTQDAKKFLDRSEQLFGEEPFAAMRFKVSDVRRAFRKVGCPATYFLDNNALEIVRKAIIFLADKNYRMLAALRLFPLLPAYVHAGRYLDAWLIQHCIWMTTEEPKESNPFLLAMFLHGYYEWEKQRDQEDEALLKELGLMPDEIRRMGVEGLSKWMEEQKRDPAKRALMEKKMAAHPDMQDAMNANCYASEITSLSILNRADAKIILLSPDEVAPWLDMLEECFQKEPFASVLTGRSLDEEMKKAMGELILGFTDEMARAIFTPPRLKQLREQLHSYYRVLSAVGDKKSMAAMNGAFMAVQASDTAKTSPFLSYLCFMSLHAVINASASSSETQGT